MQEKILLIGGFHEVIELCEKCNFVIAGIVDNALESSYHGYPIIGRDADAEILFSRYKDCKLVITPDSPSIRKKLFEHYSKIGFEFATVISPQAIISKSATIGLGTVIQAGVNVSSCSHVGDFVKLNSYCNVMHDSIVDNFVTIAPNAVLLGRAKVGVESYIGANSTILPEIQIGSNCIVGAGAVVTKNVVNNITVKGVPAK